MKFSKYFMLAGAAAAMLTACSSEEPIVGPGADQEPVDANVFFKVAFNSATTRATTTDAGLPAEQEITSAQFFFFDSKEDNAVAQEVLTVGGTGEGSISWYTESHGDAGYRGKCAVLGLEKRHDYVLAVVNAEITNPKSHTLASLLARTTSKYQNEGGNFLMTSQSEYVGGKTNVLTTVDANCWYTTEAAAKTAAYGYTTINVDRVVAKVTFDANEKYIISDDETNGQFKTGITFEFTPVKMYLTRVTTDEGFSFKNLKSRTSGFDINFGSEGMTEYKNYAGAPNAVAATPQYLFETQKANDIKVIVAGTYVAKNGEETVSAADGTFWIVNDGKGYHVVNTKEDVYELMGAPKEANYVRVLNSTSGKWTGWWALEGSPWKVMKFNAGKGYYYANFAGNSDDRQLVRNKWYKIEVKSIANVGWGLREDNSEIDPFIDPEDGEKNIYMHLNVRCNDWEVINNEVAW